MVQQGTSGSGGGRPSKLTIILLATLVPCAVVVSPVHASCQLLALAPGMPGNDSIP